MSRTTRPGQPLSGQFLDDFCNACHHWASLLLALAHTTEEAEQLLSASADMSGPTWGEQPLTWEELRESVRGVRYALGLVREAFERHSPPLIRKMAQNIAQESGEE
jgi:hypothetical protein